MFAGAGSGWRDVEERKKKNKPGRPWQATRRAEKEGSRRKTHRWKSSEQSLTRERSEEGQGERGGKGGHASAIEGNASEVH